MTSLIETEQLVQQVARNLDQHLKEKIQQEARIAELERERDQMQDERDDALRVVGLREFELKECRKAVDAALGRYFNELDGSG